MRLRCFDPVYQLASAFAQDAAVAVKDGGIFAKGWAGKIDAQEEKAGQALNNARLEEKGGELMVRTGPAVTYWNPANKAAGNYTVSATFNEAEVHGPDGSPASVRHHDRRQRSRHRDPELHLLLGLRQRHVHRSRHGPGAVRRRARASRSRTRRSTRPPARISRSSRTSRSR